MTAPLIRVCPLYSFETTDLPKFELPPPDKLPRFELPCRSPLNPDDVGLVRLYGRVYCVFVDGAATPPQINLYGLDRDQVNKWCLPWAI